MRLKTVLVISTIALLLGATPLMASSRVRIFDEQNNLLDDCDVVAYSAAGQFIGKYVADGNGIYWVDAEVGDKIVLDVSGPSSGSHIGIEKEIQTALGVNVVLEFAPPGNDACADATAVDVGTSVIGTTVEATADPEASTCGTGVTAPGVWHTVVGTGTTLTASLCSAVSDYDTKINVYCADCPNLTCVGGGDDDFACGFGTLLSTVDFCTQPGQTYRILVQGFGGQTGNYELSVSDSGAPCVAEVNCTSTGACCSCLNPPFNCTVATQADCEAQGSDYFGDNTGCTTAGAPIAPFVSSPGVGIPDNNPAGVQDTIFVPDVFLVSDVNVGVTIDHTFLADLEITLNGPGGSLPLWFDACGGDDNMDVVFDDDGGAVTCASPTVGTIDPTSVGGGDLGAFEGTSSSGNWTISVVDDAGADLGTFLSWSLELTPGEPTCPDPPVCGNGILEEGEDCDDGNNTSGDGCSANCGLEGGGGVCDEDEDDESPGSNTSGGIDTKVGQGGIVIDLMAGDAEEVQLNSDDSETVTPNEGRAERHRTIRRGGNHRGR